MASASTTAATQRSGRAEAISCGGRRGRLFLGGRIHICARAVPTGLRSLAPARTSMKTMYISPKVSILCACPRCTPVPSSTGRLLSTVGDYSESDDGEKQTTLTYIHYIHDHSSCSSLCLCLPLSLLRTCLLQLLVCIRPLARPTKPDDPLCIQPSPTPPSASN